MKTAVIKLRVIHGIEKSVSPTMQWTIEGYGGLIERKQSGNVNASSVMRRRVEWRAVDKDGKPIYIPETIRRNEKSISNWMIAEWTKNGG